jgi:hypothetical protein
MSRLYYKHEVEYTDEHGQSDESCEKCKHFEEPRYCEIVIGKIDPDGWCNKFRET